MRSSDPAAYDQISGAITGAFSNPFRALLFSTTSTAGTFTLTITQLVNGSLVGKTFSINLPVNDTFILPISGETITATSFTQPAGSVIYALI